MLKSCPSYAQTEMQLCKRAEQHLRHDRLAWVVHQGLCLTFLCLNLLAACCRSVVQMLSWSYAQTEMRLMKWPAFQGDLSSPQGLDSGGSVAHSPCCLLQEPCAEVMPKLCTDRGAGGAERGWQPGSAA